METSEDAFQELLAHLFARTNKMLGHQGYAYPLGLILNADGKVEVLVSVVEKAEQMEEVVNAMQSAMVTKVAAGSAVACCTSVPALDGKSIVAFLEDRENDCSKVSIPIAGDPPSLDIENLEVEDGALRVFPIASD